VISKKADAAHLLIVIYKLRAVGNGILLLSALEGGVGLFLPGYASNINIIINICYAVPYI
jgi:hypothetical protein